MLLNSQGRFFSFLFFTTLATGCSPNEVPQAEESILHSFDRHLPGLQEDVTFVLARRYAGSYKYVVRADGRVQSPGQLRREELAAYRARLGAMDAPLDDKFLHLSSDSVVPVTIAYEAGSLWGYPDFDLDESVRADVVGAAADRLAEELDAIGVTEIARAPHGMPMMFAHATYGQAQAVARLSEVSRVASTNHGSTTEFTPPNTPGNSLTVHRVDTAFNPAYTGMDQKIGVVENANCRLYEEHDAFAAMGTTIVHENPPITCTQHATCTAECGVFARCVGGECVSSHVSKIASEIAQTMPSGSYGAYNAEIYHPNRGDGSDVACSEYGIANAYDWLFSRSVTTATESFGCEEEDGMAQDWWARNADIAVFRAAGNISQVGNDTTWGCRPMNSICVGGFQENGSGGYEMYSDSAWGNPSTSNSDREEPDITALGSVVDVLQIIDPNTGLPTTAGWEKASGTSYAAPAAATMGVLLKEACGGTINHMFLRAIMMTGAWGINPHGTKYSTPGTGDQRDGAGAPLSDDLLMFCLGGGGGLRTKGGVFIVDLERGDDAPPWLDDSFDGGSGQLSLQPQGQPTSGTPTQIVVIDQVELQAGDRARLTMSWDNCPLTYLGTGPAQLSADLDLFLCDMAGQTCLATSRSYDNNNEGFDVTVPPATPLTTYSVVVGYNPDNSPGCNGSSLEPAAWAAVYGSATFF